MSPPPPPGDLQAASIDSLEAALTGLDIDVPAKDIVLAVRGEGAEPAKQICYATPSELALHPSNRDGAKPSSLPPEIIDLIVDYLYDESNTLKACGVVSKSWVPRTRKHLFAHVLFNSHGSTESWRELFPDSSSSPAHCAHSLTIRSVPAIMTMSTALIRSFCHVVKFKVDTWVCDDTDEWVPLHLFGGFPPTLKSLSLSCHSVPLPRIFDLICSLPLLEDLALEYQGLKSDIKGWDTHPTSPKLTGSLDLSCENPSVIQGLLDLPDGLHFSEITISCLVENAELTMDLLSMCSDNLESLCVEYMNTVDYGPRTQFPPFDLSKATKLKDVTFQLGWTTVQWVVMTLQTIKTKNLRQITIYSYGCYNQWEGVGEWHDLDCLLVELWTSHAALPKFVCKDRLRELAPSLLPELTSRGVKPEHRGDW